MDLKSIFLISLSFALINASISNEETRPNKDEGRDYCQNPETPSQRRLLEFISECGTEKSDSCSSLSDCLSENLVKISIETADACRKSYSQPTADDDESGGGFRGPCSVAATAYVLLEQIRRLLIEETVYKRCPQIKQLFVAILKKCGLEDGEHLLKNLTEGGLDELDMNDYTLQDILAKFLIGIGKRMQTYEAVKADIAELERSKHMKALGAMVVSFALPGLLGLCETAHFRTGLILQILALFVIGIYQFSRYGGYWAFVGVGSCLLVMVVELALMILVKKKCFGDEKGGEKKSE